jgi:hypothetical protein
LERKLRQDIVREVIDEDAEKREAAEKIKPEVALGGRRTARGTHLMNPGLAFAVLVDIDFRMCLLRLQK